MSNNCPVCQKSFETKCGNCGFEMPIFVFLSEDDANECYKNTVQSYKEKVELEKTKNEIEAARKAVEVEKEQAKKEVEEARILLAETQRIKDEAQKFLPLQSGHAKQFSDKYCGECGTKFDEKYCGEYGTKVNYISKLIDIVVHILSGVLYGVLLMVSAGALQVGLIRLGVNIFLRNVIFWVSFIVLFAVLGFGFIVFLNKLDEVDLFYKRQLSLSVGARVLCFICGLCIVAAVIWIVILLFKVRY